LIHHHFVKTGKLDKKFGKDLNRLFELQRIDDHGASIHIPFEEAENAIKTASLFLEAIKKMISTLD
jgi:uncharacterized protein (UPF0332 family)